MSKSSLPDTRQAMRALIEQIRAGVPFDTPLALLCQGPCSGCSKKLLEYLEMELEGWEARLSSGESPRLGDLQQLAKRSRKIYAVLQRNGLISAE